ncbi:EAL and GGDEF domain-containing protein [Metabacillus iocasae]|uniref:Diguanylate cyclase (GGDEF)-like protein/PAS domain S-box-containing protein n=1 Tax=Priestia iocasae TaxID=2291674 RepID=A0ABS2QZ09_9BACI|nr:bifunctional diguanylate cyclase/phosphodiesterase [Metabacillus iocasae]MBM7704675.1 diguanylate cyclase (GGDEF)-like protein/PAS domain S-box-containing protein [Metabacillus iocasae]
MYNENSRILNDINKLEEMIVQIILKHTHDLVYIMKIDEEGVLRYFFVNEAGKTHASLEEEYKGKTLQDVLPSHIATHLQFYYALAQTKKRKVIFQDEVILKDGQKINGESVLTPIIDEEGVCRFIVCITRDVTTVVDEKNRLIESQQRYKSLVDHNLDAVFVLDLKGNLLHANPAAFETFGYKEKEVVGRSVLSLLQEGEVHYFKEVLSKTIKGSERKTLTCKMIHKKGYIIWTQVKTVPIVVHDHITGVYVIVRDITEQLENERLMKKMAFYDYLTKLPNRNSLNERLTEAITNASKRHEQLALIYMDLDRFKFLNDTLGHDAGDQLLKSVARRLDSLSNDYVSVFRQGGDEFVVLIEDTTIEQAERLAKQILSLFSVPFSLNLNQEYYVTPSMGISMFPNDGQERAMLVKCADIALYRVKEQGRAHYQFYHHSMLQSTPYMMLIETGLRKAINQNEFVVFYQPQVDLCDETINSFEALLRWNSPTLGFVAPNEFIPLAEDTGLILPIGTWVFEEVCRQIKEWYEKGYGYKTVAVNLSTKQFQQSTLVETIEGILKKFNIPPHCLEIEITEGALKDARETISVLKRLKEIGVQISVDDFGTGYSSLSYLKRFPLDCLKIDQSFIAELLTNPTDEAITTTIIHLAQKLNLTVIAEGVEEQEQAQFLKEINCEKAQGYYFSRPLPAHEVEKFFQQ